MELWELRWADEIGDRRHHAREPAPYPVDNGGSGVTAAQDRLHRGQKTEWEATEGLLPQARLYGMNEWMNKETHEWS